MALSEYEQRKLEEIERALHGDDPGFASSIEMGVIRRHRRVGAAVVLMVGVLVLIAGAVAAQGLPLAGVVVSVVGFVVMVAGAGLFVAGRPGRSPATAGRGPDTNGPGVQPGSSRRARMEERIRHRFDHLDE
jgi:predicted membrane channel-forming protein YqfA (hemolysin III family)